MTIFRIARSFLVVCLFLTTMACCLKCHAVEVSRQPVLFFADNDALTINTINLDGSSHEVIVSTNRVLIGLTVDSVTRKIYWSTNADRARIHKSELDGSIAQTIYESILQFQGETAGQLALDVARQHIYWIGRVNREPFVFRAKTDGSEIETVVRDLPDINALDFSRVHQRLFLGQDLSSTTGTIWSTEPDGSDVQTVFGASATSLFVDEQSNRIIGSDFFRDIIYEVDLNTSMRRDLGFAQDTRDIIRFGDSIYYTGLTFDPIDGHTANIFRANLDGSNPESIYSRLRRNSPADPIQLAIFAPVIPEPNAMVLLITAVVVILVRRQWT